MSLFPIDPGRVSIGTFVKTPSHQTVEILGLCRLDFVVLDAEHAAFDRTSMDVMLLAARAAGLPMLVRIAERTDAAVQCALDLGAAGIVVPHVDCAADAIDAVRAARFVGGRRGLSLSPRFANYGTMGQRDAVARGDQCAIVCQIESAAAVREVEAIAAVRGVSALLIGRLDLALSLGVEGPAHPAVLAAVRRIVAAARAVKLPIVVAIGSHLEMADMHREGAHAFIIGSDQSLLKEAAGGLRTALGTQPLL